MLSFYEAEFEESEVGENTPLRMVSEEISFHSVGGFYMDFTVENVPNPRYITTCGKQVHQYELSDSHQFNWPPERKFEKTNEFGTSLEDDDPVVAIRCTFRTCFVFTGISVFIITHSGGLVPFFRSD